METIRSLFVRTGVKKATYGALVAIVFFVFDFEFLAFLAFVITIVLLLAYRNPKRLGVEISDFGVLSPVDGKVSSIQTVQDSAYGYIVTIEANPLHAAVARIPFEASLQRLSFFRGSRLSPASALFDKLNERLEIVLQKEQKRVKIVHILKRSPFSIEVFLNKNLHEQIAPQVPYGYVFNAITHIYLPRNFRLNVSKGKTVYAGQNIIGYFSG